MNQEDQTKESGFTESTLETTQITTETTSAETTSVPTELPTEETAQSPTEIPNEETTPLPVETPSAETTQSPSETPTEETVQAPTEIPNEETTQIATEVPTEEVTQDSTGISPDFNAYSVSCIWKNGGSPDFTCSPVWNPDQHCYDQWQFVCNDTVIIKNNSTNVDTIKVRVIFSTTDNINGVFQLQEDAPSQQELIIDLEYGSTVEVIFSILNNSTPIAEENMEVQIGTISCEIIGTASQEQTSAFSENTITTQEEIEIPTELEEPIEEPSEIPVEQSAQAEENIEVSSDAILDEPTQDQVDGEQDNINTESESNSDSLVEEASLSEQEEYYATTDS